jgi:sortase A
VTALRPERDSGAAYGGAAESGSSYGQQPYEDPDTWQQGQEWSAYGQYPADGGAGYGQQPYAQQAPQQSYDTTTVAPSYGEPATGASYGQPTPGPSYGEPVTVPSYGGPGLAGGAGSVDNETVALRASEVQEARQVAHRAGEPVPAPGGRAARRKAARRHGRRGVGPQTAERPAGTAEEAPRSRMEARRAARAQKPGAGVLVSRVVGELFITTGVVMLLFVTYQLWWSNVRAHEEAGRAAQHLQQDWASGKRAPGEFAPGQGFAILHIPKLDVVAPIAEGTSKTKVLDKGMVGHYGEGSL